MNKAMRELMAQIQAKTAEAKKYMNGSDGVEKDVEKASQIMDEVDALRKEYETEKRLYESEKADGVESATPHTSEKKNPIALFAKAVRAMISGKALDEDVLQEGVDESGGYTVPEDIQTKVNQWRDVDYDLLQEIDVVPVKTVKGSRTYQKRGTADVFTVIDEGGAIDTQIEAPQFERVSYEIKDRAGFMPVTNNLINDSDASITAIITEWLGKAKIATGNKIILDMVATKDAIALDGIGGIKTVVNVTLGQVYRGVTKIITNDDGLNYLDQLVDNNGRPLLNPDPTDSAKLQLRCGATVIPIKVIPNKVLASNGTKIPFIIGSLKDAIRKWDRQSMSIAPSTVATIGNFNAFAQNMTLFRAIMRDDFTAMDFDAFVNGYIDTAEESEENEEG